MNFVFCILLNVFVMLFSDLFKINLILCKCVVYCGVCVSVLLFRAFFIAFFAFVTYC